MKMVAAAAARRTPTLLTMEAGGAARRYIRQGSRREGGRGSARIIEGLRFPSCGCRRNVD